jgi:hypothetical protein
MLVLFVFFFVPFVYGPQLTSGGSIRKFKFLLLGGRPMVGLQTLDLAIGVRVPASQPNRFNTGSSSQLPVLSVLILVSNCRNRARSQTR